MQTTTSSLVEDTGSVFNSTGPKSAASWGAIFAGALVAVSVSLVLVALGSGLGFASISPWADRGVEASTFAISAVIWLIIVQWISSLLGGYIVGRLRTRWIGTHVHEIFFRDTAHGLVTWALATVVVAAVVAGTVSSGAGGGLHVAMAGTHGGATGMSGSSGVDVGGYAVDKLFRSTEAREPAGTGENHALTEARGETLRLMANAAVSGRVPADDRAYLVSLVVANAGASQTEAQRRVEGFIADADTAATKLKAQADAARKDAAEVSIYTALAMLIGAFIASVSAAMAGRLRDEHI